MQGTIGLPGYKGLKGDNGLQGGNGMKGPKVNYLEKIFNKFRISVVFKGFEGSMGLEGLPGIRVSII